MPEANVKLEGVPCILCCCLFIFISVDIAAVVVSQQDSPECDGQGSIMQPAAFTTMAGLIGIILSLIGVCIACCVFPIQDPDTDTRNIRGQFAWIMLTAFIYGALSIIGFLNYGSEPMTDDCQQGPLGQVTLAWSVIRMMSAVCTTLIAASWGQKHK